MFSGGRSIVGKGALRAREMVGAVPPTGLVVLPIFSVQLGAAIAKGLFNSLGPGGTVFLRIAFAALAVLVLWRPGLRGYAGREYLLAALFGLTLAGMNLSIYMAFDRIPLGIAVTLEFIGPLTVSVAGFRRILDLLWVVLAAAGILLLAPLGVLGDTNLDPVGVGFALVAGSLWACYILLSTRTGRAFPGMAGLAIALFVGTVALLPVGVVSAGAAMLDPGLLLAGLAVALLSSVVPYSLELEALRRLPARVFGVLMSLEPAVAALVGFLVLGEQLGPRALSAMALVTLAAAGASRFAGSR